jgi:hypothetical protein
MIPSPVRGETDFMLHMVPEPIYVARFAGLMSGMAFKPRAYARGYEYAARYRGLVDAFLFVCGPLPLLRFPCDCDQTTTEVILKTVNRIALLTIPAPLISDSPH